MKLKRDTALSAFISIIGIAAIIRLDNLLECGFKFCDEGYHLLYPSIFHLGQNPRFYFKHGLMMWIVAGLNVFGFSSEGALFFSALCGIFTTMLFYVIIKNWQPVLFALLGLFCFSTNYYILFYHRCFMSDGFALFFFSIEFIFLICLFRLYRLLPGGPGVLKAIKKYRLSLLVFSGLLLGFIFTVRIQTCLILFGFIGALGVALLFKAKSMRRKKIKLLVLRYIYVFLLLFLFAVLGYTLFMYSIKDYVNWDSTLEWYMKNVFAATGKSTTSWKLYLVENLWHLCGLPFLVVSLLGVLWELKEIRKLNVARLWLLISFLGITAFYLAMSLPWPRAYLYYVFFLVIYWSFAVERFSALTFFSGRKNLKALAIGLLVAATALAELKLSWPLFSKRSNYKAASDFVAGKSGGVSFSAAQSWPIFMEKNILAKVHIIIENDYGTYENMLWLLKSNLQNLGVRYLILDHYISYAETNKKLLKEFVKKNDPAASFKNDFGNDYHVCMDAFGRLPTHDEFSDKIMIFDMRALPAVKAESHKKQ